ncbi:type II toxin-antitoxin system RelB/DinJ family antitoxin [Thiomicrospira microaerophila]|uniref:type II toxin-antitoxin system RelB/DinJ family antitoxin n=1 Tax=Thiomicrospira microaerophila TaxID=406020 RepID=UPI0020100004|nr:type II toxin-antitoxin system RelB/DinJ family antitoxin [Thiomicrospira microaerophila]UQB42275.1 type II toxin-antitoxin system RelB/DinJ family antitoxin [Thiomicrospira microaerophila]
MGTITIRVDDELKSEAYQALENLNITPSELLRQTLKYVAQNHKLPFKPALLSEEDFDLLETVRERLNDPKPVAVSLDDL